MRVLQVIDCFERSGGAQQFFRDLISEMNREGVNVEVLSIIPPQNGNGEFVDRATQQGIPVHILTDRSIYDVRNVFAMHHFLHEHVYDIIHVHLFPALYFCALAKPKGVKLLYTEHSTDNRRRHSLLFRRIDAWIYRHYERVVCISAKTRESLHGKVSKRIPTIDIANGIDLAKFREAMPLPINRELGIPDGAKFIAMCARFQAGKDYMTLLKSVKYLPDNYHILCIGDGPLREECETFCQVNNLLGQVHFLGLRADVANLFQASDVVVLSTSHEGFSIVMLEAMACGKPFVASAVPGIEDLVKDYAVLFPFGDEIALADCIKKLLSDSDYYNTIASKSIQFSSRYDIKHTARHYIEVYKECLK